jgi:penicillin-binding protein 2
MSLAGPPLPRQLHNDEKISPTKLAGVQYVIVLVLAVLVAGLWRLQVLGSDNWKVLAEANRIKKVPVLAPRGKIFDREGRLLVDNYPSVTCYLLPEQLHDPNVDLPLIAKGLHLTVAQIQTILNRYKGAAKYQPIPLKQDVAPDEEAFIEAHRNELPELETHDEQRRLYPRDGFAAHLIGYVGEVSEAMLNNDSRYAFYSPGDVVGQSGVEQTYDALLRGTDGSRDILVNSHGKEVGLHGQEMAIPGKDLRLTIDLDIQRAAEKALDGKNGAIVAMDPHTGEILAMVSRPAFDPNQFAVRLTRSYWNEILNNPDHPLMNKAIQAQLAPGSTFKIIMSAAGLQENVAQDMHVVCNGGADFYGHYFKCDVHHGMVNIDNAIPYSCDTFYYTLANRLGIDTIARYANEFGLGQRTGVDLPEEALGTVPSTMWALKNFHRKWYAGETISVGIGQGAVTVTPIQMARAIGGIASGGVMHRPHLVFPDEVPADVFTSLSENHPGSGEKTVPLTAANWETITDGMAQTVQPGAFHTAAAARLDGIDFAGKTGTADVVGGRVKNSTNLATLPNAWFVGVAPRRNPDIVVAVLWEHGYWGKNSARLAAQIVNAFVTKQRRLANNLRLAEAPKAAPAPDTTPTASNAAPHVPAAE